MFLSIIFCFFAAFGVFQVLYAFACYMTRGKGDVHKEVHRLVPITNDMNDIEGYIRYLALKDNEENVILLNMTDDVETIRLMRLLAAEFEFVYIMTKDEYIEYIEDGIE